MSDVSSASQHRLHRDPGRRLCPGHGTRESKRGKQSSNRHWGLYSLLFFPFVLGGGKLDKVNTLPQPTIKCRFT